jgi:surface antigen
MTSKTRPAPLLLLALLTTAPGLVNGFDLSFLDQAPLRFLTEADTRLLEATIGDVLAHAADGEGRSWTGAESGNSGTVTAVKSFVKNGLRCRRIEVVTSARKATMGGGRSQADLCDIDGEWKILRLPQ